MQQIKKFFFTNQTVKQTIIKNTLWIAVSTIAMKIIRAAIIIYAARLLGTEGYGTFSYAMSIAGIFAMFSDMGLSSLLTRELIQQKQESRSYLATSFLVKGMFIVVVIIAIATLGPLVSRFENASTLMSILALSIGFESVRNFLYSISRAQNNMQLEAGVGFLSEIICTAFVVMIFFTNPSAYSLSLAYMIGNAISLLITIYAIRQHVSGFYRHIQKSLIYPILKMSWPFTIMGIFGILMTNIDAVILGYFSNEATLGLYGAAQRSVSILYLIPGFLNTALLPIMSKLATKEDSDHLQVVTKKSAIISIGVALPIVMGGMIVVQPFLNAAFGYDYVGAALTLKILLVSLLFSFPASIFSDMLLAKDKRKMLVLASVLGAVTNVTLDLLFIPWWGIAGSAIATVAAQLVACVILYRGAQGVRLHLGENIWKMILASIVMLLLVAWFVSFSLPLLITIPLGAIVYLAVLFILRDRVLKDFFEALKI